MASGPCDRAASKDHKHDNRQFHSPSFELRPRGALSFPPSAVVTHLATARKTPEQTRLLRPVALGRHFVTKGAVLYTGWALNPPHGKADGATAAVVQAHASSVTRAAWGYLDNSGGPSWRGATIQTNLWGLGNDLVRQ